MTAAVIDATAATAVTAAVKDSDVAASVNALEKVAVADAATVGNILDN